MLKRARHKTSFLTLTMTLMVTVTSGALKDDKSLLLSRPIDDLLLEQHNIFRQEEAATNIFKMHWNSSVAAAAGRWASHCKFEHQLSGLYGENLFYSSDPDFEGYDIREILLGGLELWHDEKRGWRYSSDTCGAACHYTQMVWASTTSVGCAHQMCHGLDLGGRSADRALYLVCFYYPRGNWIGEYPFKKGARCSECGSGTCQDGLCVEQKTTFSSYHSQSENEVKSGSEWNWEYSARGRDSHRQESAFHNVSHVTSRDPAQNGFRHTSSRHTQHDVRIKTASGHHSHRTSSSVYRVSHSSQNRKDVELRQREMTYTSGGNLGEEFESYNPSRSRVQRLPPASLRQSPRQAQYARSAQDRISRRRNIDSNNINDNNYRRELQRDASSSRRGLSPLDVLRADTHWCRDRLPSCRTWARNCMKSKAVYMACPRTCGHCGKNKDEKKPHSLRDRPPPSSPPLRSPNRSSPHHNQQRVSLRQHHQRQRQQQGRSPLQLRDPRQQQHQQELRSRSAIQHQRGRIQKPKQQRLRLQQRKKKNGGKQRGGKKRGDKKRRHGQKKGPRKGPRKGQRKGHRQRNAGAKRRRLVVGRRGKERRQRHKAFQTVDKRAENLAQELRMEALNGGRCEDDPKYTRSCPMWVGKGFCNGNVLVSNVYCKLSCGSC